ncbi:MAG: HlyC/CorC family transporter [Dehalococcoidia bacterium]|nr:HlyC/CorC family transporter [Dehalococcoidia bacterium]
MGNDLFAESLLIVVLLAINALLAASEIALISASRPRLIRQSEADADAKAALRLLGNPERFLATIQVGITISSFFASAVGALSFVLALDKLLQGSGLGILREYSNGIAVVAVTLLLSFLSVVFGELIPKRLAIRYADRVTLAVARPMEWVAAAVNPLVAVLNFVARIVLTLIGQGKIVDEVRPSVTEADLRIMFDVATSEGDVEEREARMLHRVFELTDRQAHEVMTPRPEIDWLDKDDTFADFLPVYAETNHTRYPVCDGEPDMVLGVFSIKDALREISTSHLAPERKLIDLMRPAYFVPETKKVGDLFEDMRTSGQAVAFVVDEYGGTSGMITLKQLVEEIVGRVTDEDAPTDEPEWVRLDENTVRVDGSMRIDEANESLDLDLPTGDYETVAGLVLHELGHIPAEGEQVELGELRLVVAKMVGVKVEQLHVIRS